MGANPGKPAEIRPIAFIEPIQYTVIRIRGEMMNHVHAISAHLARRVLTVAGGAAFLLMVNAGCQTISDDFADATGGLFPPSPTEAAQMMLDPHDPDRRREGTNWIGNSPFGGADVYVRAYRDYVQHEQHELVLVEAIRALARHGTPDDAPLIAKHLTHPNAQVRWQAARGLQRLHNPVVVNALLDRLRDESEEPDVRIAAAVAVGQYPQDRVFQALVSALLTRHLAINTAARESLVTLTSKDFGFEARDWMNWYNQQNDPFAEQQAYLYPTYHRDYNWFEKLVMWSPKMQEQPAPPAGLRPSDQRSTYDDEDDQQEQGG